MGGRSSHTLNQPSNHGPDQRKNSAHSGIYYGWVLAVALAITQLTSWGILYYTISVFFVPMEREMGWTRAESSGAFSLGLLISGVAAVPIGRWLDRHGGRLLMTVGSVVGVALLVAWSTVEDLPSFYLLWSGLGVVMASTLYEAAFAVVTAWFQRHRARALTVVAFFGGLASTIMLPVTNWLVETQGWRAALLSLAIILAAIAVPVHGLMVRHRPVENKPHPETGSKPLPCASGAATAGSGPMVGASVHLMPYLSALTNLIAANADSGHAVRFSRLESTRATTAATVATQTSRSHAAW